MASNFTENYGLCQWEATDQVLREEFNQDNAKMNAALRDQNNMLLELAQKGLALEALIGQRGNCSIETFTYQGTGTYGEDNPTVITFSKQPAAFLIWPMPGNDGGDAIMVGRGGDTQMRCFGYDMNGPYCDFWWVTASWSGNQISFYSSNPYQGYYQLNYPNTSYLVIAFYLA